MAVATDTEAPRLLTRSTVLGDALATFRPGEDKLWVATLTERLKDAWPGEYDHLNYDLLRIVLAEGDRQERVRISDTWGQGGGQGCVRKGVTRVDLQCALDATLEREACPPPVEHAPFGERMWRLIEAVSATCDRVMPILGAGAYLALIVAVAVLVARRW